MPDSISILTINHDQPVSPPTSKLDNDILWYIFYLNADMESWNTEKFIPALLTLRYTSQVCRDWRSFVVESSSFWARVVNFNVLSQKREEWRKEVIRRTGTAPLHIMSHGNHTALWGIDDFFRDFLEENWNRLYSLDVFFGHECRAIVPGKWASLLHRTPAPSLRSFKFKWQARPEEFYNPDFSLFKNTATSLRELSVVNMNLDLTALSTPNIRRLEINEPVAASDLLRALGRMPLLEALTLDSLRGGPVIRGEIALPSASYPQVSLPQLTEINFSEREGADGSLSLLLHIQPGLGCALSYSCWFAYHSPVHVNIELYCSILSTYSRYCQELSSATVLDVTISDNQFSFDIPLPHKRCFSFGMENYVDRFPQQTVPSLLYSLTTLQLDKITKLKLIIEFGESFLLDSETLKFVFAFVSVEDWTTNALSLKALTLIQSKKPDALAFPSLKTIYLDHIRNLGHLSHVVDFLDGRISRERPVKTLALVQGGSVTVDIEPLRKFYPYLELPLPEPQM
ncbi:hypothetical protein GALMADRAFT_258381 [Galerina marginata CBS 339.88]|uniref:F-box domain-containing protein n=1 Tax=Galerina marginata (strain CBS 339.88) TaxID=685588 RepID=A0A067SIC5_GALM3|nr:hypothetical protein GALMADRAFT_258381 [Galerina marginata CBS 339.88]